MKEERGFEIIELCNEKNHNKLELISLELITKA